MCVSVYMQVYACDIVFLTVYPCVYSAFSKIKLLWEIPHGPPPPPHPTPPPPPKKKQKQNETQKKPRLVMYKV